MPEIGLSLGEIRLCTGCYFITASLSFPGCDLQQQNENESGKQKTCQVPLVPGYTKLLKLHVLAFDFSCQWKEAKG